MSNPVNAARKQRSISIGLIVTAIVAALTSTGAIDPLERISFDLRSRWFSNATPPPSDRVVHIDIDDRALETWKRWPWPRADLAAVLDQLNTAGAQVIAFDLLFDEPQPVRYEPVAGSSDPQRIETIRDDHVLARAIREGEHDVLAIACEVRQDREPWQQRAIEVLARNLALDINTLAKRAYLTAPQRDRCMEQLSKFRLAAIRDALYDAHARLEAVPTADRAIEQLLPDGPDDALQRMITTERDRIATAVKLLETYPTSENKTRRYVLNVPIDVLSEACANAGSVSFEADTDGTVRTMPLWVETHGRLMPHFSLAAAAEYLQVPLDTIHIEANTTILPDAHMPDGSVQTIRIPMIHPRSSDGYAMFPRYRINMTWPSNSGTWKTLYDPDDAQPVQHISIGAIIELSEMQKSLANNETGAQVAFAELANETQLASMIGAGLTNRYVEINEALATEDLTDAERQALHDERDGMYADVLENCEFVKEEFTGLAPEDLSEDEARLKALLDDAYPRLKAFSAAASTGRPIITQRLRMLRDQVDGRICLVGWTATGSITDKIHTALHPDTPGVVGHGAIINQILTGHYLGRVSVWVDLLMVVVLGTCVTLIASWMPPVRALVISSVLGVTYFLVNGAVMFDYGNVVVAAAGPCVGGMAAWMAVTVYRMVREQRERARITKQFKNYVSKDLVDLLVADPMLIKQGRHELTCMFCDIAGFTKVSEQLGPEQIIELLNRYLSVMTHRIMDGRGTVNKYMGDCIMAFWGAPLDDDNHTLNACLSVLSCFEAMKELEKDPFFQELPKFTIRFGLATGPMMVGDCGAPPDRSDYTVIGDTVNLASRLESANKQFDTKVLVNERTAELLGDHMLVRPIGRIQVVGKADSVAVFELLNTTEHATEAQRRLANLTGRMVESFGQRAFEQCTQLCNEIDDAFGSTRLTALYTAACETHQQTAPPDSFRGELVLSEK